MDLVTRRTYLSHYVATRAAFQDDFNHNVFPILDTENDVVFFWLENAQLRVVVVVSLFIPASLVQ